MVSGKMNGLKKLGLIGAAGVALIAALLVITQASGASGTLWVTDANTAPDGSASVQVIADVGDPGLGAWTLDVQYDPMALTVTDCEEDAGSVCNAAFADDLVRVTGASASGHDEETVLATITFECKAEGTSSLDLIVSVFADATIGDPQDIDPLTEMSGEFACKEQPEPTEEPTDEPTDEPDDAVDDDDDEPILPITGQGFGQGSGGSSATTWLIVALAAAGLAGIGGFGALRLRRN